LRKEILWGIPCIILTALLLLPMLLPPVSWPVLVRDSLVSWGYRDTGAPNLVAAVYLGYRAYDTLGELVVLLAALSTAMGLIRGTEKTAPISADIPTQPAGTLRNRKMHTDIIDMTAGKLSPMVLLFGCYLMAYGYESPGGGFQGGVVLASGIIFIALGRREGGAGFLGNAALGWVEMISFLLILLLCLAGPLRRGLILENPVPGEWGLNPAAYIIAFNIVIGLKVGSGIAMTCLLMLERSYAPPPGLKDGGSPHD
jgi:multicomponent Na+:H+ antiporter subunit B